MGRKPIVKTLRKPETDGGSENRIETEYGAVDLTRVESSNVHSIGKLGGDLFVVFNRGVSTYRYPGAGDLLDDFLASESKGKFFSAKVRNLRCEKIHARFT